MKTCQHTSALTGHYNEGRGGRAQIRERERMSTPHENQAVVEKLVEAINTGEITQVASELIADNLVRHDLTDPPPNGAESSGVTDLMRRLRAASPDLQFEIVDIFASDDRVALHYIMTGTHQGHFLGVGPTGRRFQLHGVNLYRLENGKVVETWQLGDVLGFMTQVGAVDLK